MIQSDKLAKHLPPGGALAALLGLTPTADEAEAVESYLAPGAETTPEPRRAAAAAAAPAQPHNPDAARTRRNRLPDKAHGKRAARTPSGAPRPRFADEEIEITIRVRHDNAPATIAALTEIRNELGSRLSAPHEFSREDALTRAVAGLASIHAGFSAAGYTLPDPDYR